MSRHWLTVLSLATNLITFVSAQDNQCFSAANQRAGSIIVPCTNSTSYTSCCQLGDLCLSDSACWNVEYNVTYLYGCTDPLYTDYTCPYKCGPTFANAPYVGIDYCANTTNDEWSCTQPQTSDEAIQPFDYTAPCLNNSIIAFAGPVSLPAYLSLPSSIGGSTLYYSPQGGSSVPVTGYTPTTIVQVTVSVPTTVKYVGSTVTRSAPSTPPSTSSTAPTSSAPTTVAPISATPAMSSLATSSSNSGFPLNNGGPSSSSSPSNTGLKVGLKVGVGVGIAGGVLFFAALIFFFLLWRRCQNRLAAIPQHETEDHPYNGAYAAQGEKNATPYQNGPVMGAGGFGHQRQPLELAADNVDPYRNPRKPVGSQSMANSTQRSPAPLYWEFEGSPVPTHNPPAAPQRFEMGESR